MTAIGSLLSLPIRNHTATWDSLPGFLADLIVPEPMSGCWLWLGRYNKKGYPLVTLPDGTLTNAHTPIYEAVLGPIAEGLELDHLCRTRACVSPWHHEPVTHSENMIRAHAARPRKDPLPIAPPPPRDTAACGHPFTATISNGRKDPSRKICGDCHRARRRDDMRRARLRWAGRRAPLQPSSNEVSA